jgi:hypothetical protein
VVTGGALGLPTPSSGLHVCRKLTFERGIFMTNFSRITKISLLIIFVLGLASASWSQKCPAAAEKIAQAYGIDSFGQIDAVRSTFNIDFPGLKVAQSWIWEPKADRVTYEGKDKAGNPVTITYVRSQLSSQPDNVKNEIDPSFNNNQYWLFLPFHACWDTAAKVEDSGVHKLPMGGGSARRVIVTYPPEGGGYTPGDTWEMYVGPDNRIQQLLWRRGPGKPSIVKIVNAKWLDYNKVGPLFISLDHRGTGDGKPLRIFFTDVAVKLAGSDKWVNAQ